MSKITREQVIEAAPIGTSYHNAALMSLIDQREAEFQELVDATGEHLKYCDENELPYSITVREAYEKLCPPPDPHKQLADRLRCAANWIDGQEDYSVVTEIRAVANEIEWAGDK